MCYVQIESVILIQLLGLAFEVNTMEARVLPPCVLEENKILELVRHHPVTCISQKNKTIDVADCLGVSKSRQENTVLVKNSSRGVYITRGHKLSALIKKYLPPA